MMMYTLYSLDPGFAIQRSGIQALEVKRLGFLLLAAAWPTEKRLTLLCLQHLHMSSVLSARTGKAPVNSKGSLLTPFRKRSLPLKHRYLVLGVCQNSST